MRRIKRTAPFEKSALSVAICLGLAAMAPNAQAVQLNADATVTVDGSTTSDTDSGTVSVNASAYGFGVLGTANSAGRGNDSGWMYSRAGGNGIFSAQGYIQQSVTFTNTSGIAQNYFFDFTINRGSLSAYDYAGLNGDFIQAGNDVAITLNGTAIFTSTANLRNDDSGANLVTTGTVLGSYSSGSESYFWGPYTDTLDLGVFGAGETFTLEYDILTFADGDIVNRVCDNDGYGGYGEVGNGYGEVIGDDGYGLCDMSYARSQFGDPNNINSIPAFTGVTFTGVPTTSVPEPGTLFLMGSGVLGLAFARRRKQRQH